MDEDLIREQLKSVSWKLLAAEVSRRNRERRKAPPGRKLKLRPCPKCGAMCGARELKYIHPKTCPKRKPTV